MIGIDALRLAIHAVDKTHAGKHDSSVLYIPACPLTEANAQYLVRQREAFLQGTSIPAYTLNSPNPKRKTSLLTTNLARLGTPGPDFPSSGLGESQHLGRLTPDFVMQNVDVEAQRAMGLMRYDDQKKGLPDREQRMLERANEILGF